MNSGLEAVTIPKWGIEMSEGTVAEWLKGEGDSFAKGDSLVVIETDKIANEVEATRDAAICRILAQPGEVLPVGALIAVTAVGDVSAAEIEKFIEGYQPVDASFEPKDESNGSAAENVPGEVVSAVEEAVVEDDNYTLPDDINISPAALDLARRNRLELSEVSASGNMGRISLQDVEQFLRKKTANGTTTKELKPPVTVANISPMARLLAEELAVDLSDIPATGRGGRITLQDVEQAAKRQGIDLMEQSAQLAGSLSRRSTPLARRLAEQLGIDISTVNGSGGHGKILKEDVLSAVQKPGIPTGADNPARTEKLSAMRRTIAKRLMEAKQTVPHFYLTMDVLMDNLLVVREQLNGRPDVEARVSVNDLIIRAAALALKEVPEANASFHDDAITFYERADISVAVAVDGGLVTPVVRGADLKSVDMISAEMKEFAERARNGALMPEDYKGGSFSISNLGMYGIRNFDAIINPPQGAILAVGETRHAQVYENGKGTWKQQMTVTLSCDHRVIDGAVGAKFLSAFRQRIENAVQLVV